MRVAFAHHWRRSPASVRAFASAVARAVRMYLADNCSVYAAAIAYYALFSLVPLSVITLSIFGLVVDRQSIVDFVFDQLPLRDTASVQEDVVRLVVRAQQVSLAGLSVGVVVLVWSGSGIFSAVRRGLDATGHRPHGRAYWRSKLIDLALIPGLGTLIWLSLSLAAAAQVAVERTGTIGPLDLETNLLVRLLSFLVPAGASFGMFALLYRYIPTARPAWREALAGATFATILFELVKRVGAIIVSYAPFSKDTAVYAGFGTAFAFLFWMYLVGSILLLGSEFARAVGAQRNGEAP